MTTITMKLVFKLPSESEASGSTLATPSQGRRKSGAAFPTSHPHRQRRKVSAPPELQHHFGGGHAGANHPPISNAVVPVELTPEYIVNLQAPHTHGSDAVYSGSDSGVPSEYSSWTPGSHRLRNEASSPDDFPSTATSFENLIEAQNTNRQVTQPREYFSDSEADCESLGSMTSPLSRRKNGGLTNGAYMHTESVNPPNQPLVVTVGDPPPLRRTPTEPIFSSSPSMMSSNMLAGNRKNSMIVQLNLQGMQPQVASPVGPNHRSVSMISLNTAGQGPMPQQGAAYPNLASLNNADTQSIYSVVMPTDHRDYLGSNGSIAGVGTYKGHLTPSLSPSGQPSPNPQGDETDGPFPTEEVDKKRWFKETLSENASLMYGLFLFTLAAVIYIGDTFAPNQSSMAEGFNIYLIVVGIIWLGYLHFDVRRYLQTIYSAYKDAKERQGDTNEPVQVEPTGDGQYQLRINLPEPKKTIPQHYGFTSGRHGGSLYLKIGATVFCFGHLIHTGLNLGQKVLYITDESITNCTSTVDIVLSVLEPVFAFYQLFFIFKYSNLIINRHKLLARFALAHCISASLCFWFYTIIQETLQSIVSKSSKGDYSTDYHKADLDPFKAAASQFMDDASDEDDDDRKEMIMKMMKIYAQPKVYTSKQANFSFNYGCNATTELTDMINTTTPYLFPFSIEYNILIVGVWILLWENIGKVERHTHIPSIEISYDETNEKTFTSNLIIYVDCHSSNRGLFAGLLVTVATVISIILFFIFTSSSESVDLGLLVNGYSGIILLSVMLIVGIAAFNAIRTLDVCQHAVSQVDDILLFICLPCIFLYAFLNILPAAMGGDDLFVVVSTLQILQVLVQTALICDGLRRCSNSSTLQQKKPAREVITFLVVANVAMWLLETFEIKSYEGQSANYEFYGKEMWTLLSHLTLPLALFYRFHSSVCLADMWKVCYEPEESH